MLPFTVAGAEQSAQPVDELVTTIRKTQESKIEVPLAISTFTAAATTWKAAICTTRRR